MPFWEILDTILLKSLELIFETVYMLAYRLIGNPGLSIIVLSLFMNFMVLPLYMRADTIQEEEHALERKLQKGLDFCVNLWDNGNQEWTQIYCAHLTD